MRARSSASAAAVVGLALLSACTSGDAPPAPLDTATETCAFCRMPVSDARLAAQLAAPAEEPVFFDDIGCLRDFLGSRIASKEPPKTGAVAWVADHRTGDWVRAADAAYGMCPGLATPMGSHLIAHADASSRDADPATRGCERRSAAEVFGSVPPGGSKQGG